LRIYKCSVAIRSRFEKMKNTDDAFGHFYNTIEVIRRKGTAAITPQHITSWHLEEVADGTMIGMVPFPNGTVFHLSIGSYENGTSYPTKFGAHVTIPNGSKVVWFDWKVYSDEKHKNPHVQFSDKPSKRYSIFDDADWLAISNKLDLLKRSY
jgi:hypothetical protein